MSRRALEWAARLYPARWRRRYGTEFCALLEESDSGWVAIADVLKGALAMQIRSWSIWKFVAACAVIGAAIAGLVSWRAPKVYVSSAVMRFNVDDSVARERLGAMLQEVLSRNTLSTIITASGLYPADRAQRPIEDIIRDMRAHIYVTLVTGIHPTAFKISFLGSSPAQANQVTGLLVSQLIDKNFEARAGLMEVLDPPTLPHRPRPPNGPMMMAIGVLLGVVLGLIAFRMAGRSKRDANA
ncbi:MAG: hypothetical protein WBY44_05705 [Bryobacteraceae bacterium]